MPYEKFGEGLDKTMRKMKQKKIWTKEAPLAEMLIREIKNPLDLLRELLSNAAAKEVEANKITISVYKEPKFGQVFEVEDTGRGMDLTDNIENPGRLDRFLSLGFSGIAGLKTDEFGWKGIGSKLTFRSRMVDVDTYSKDKKCRYHVRIDDPWKAIEERRLPKPTYSEQEASGAKYGAIIKVFGYPLYKLSGVSKISFDSVRDYLMHRTFVGFTRKRENPPGISLKAVNPEGESIEEVLNIGFPVLKKAGIDENWQGCRTEKNGEVVIISKTYNKNFRGKAKGIQIHVKGIYTAPEHAKEYGLQSPLAQGLILSVNGIPYCKLDLGAFTKAGIKMTPGEKNLCFVVECDAIGRDMNISRSGYTPSERTQLFEQLMREVLEEINSSQEYRKFDKILRERKQAQTAEKMTETLESLQKEEFGWVYLKDKPEKILHRIPQTEQDTLSILWKLEGAGKLKSIFKEFLTLSATTGEGTDLWVDFQETPTDVKNKTLVEAKLRFTPKSLGHPARQTPIVICWEISPKVKTKRDSQTPYKHTVEIEGVNVTIYVLKEMKEIIVTAHDLTG